MTDDLQDQMSSFQRCFEARDRTGAETILDEGFALVLVHPSPATMPRARWLEVLPDYVVHSYEVEDQQVAVDGDCAAVIHRASMRATVLGEDRSGSFVISDVWRLRGGAWRLWRRHSTPLEAGSLPGTDT